MSRHGRFVADPAAEELEKFFFLDEAALAEARDRRRAHNRLGWAVQWGTVRMLGTFLTDSGPVDPARPVGETARRRPARAARAGPVADALRDRRPGGGDPHPQRRGPRPGVRRARVTSKGGAVEYVHWATGTARLLPRLLRGRTAGPVFLAGGRAPAAGRRAPAAGDICPATGRGRLSYPRAEYLFKQASAALDPHEKGWTLHQLRHSALQHLAADGRTAPELQAKSRHQHLASLGRYVRLGEQTSARVTAEADRRRTR